MMAAQIVHAADDSHGPDRLPEGTYAIALWATAQQLQQLRECLVASGVEHALVVENEGPWAGHATAIGIRPILKSVARRYVSHLPRVKP
jgi:hypothetical protein